MSGMKLRDSIRAPVRFGEDESETPARNFLRPGTEESYDEESMELGESGRARLHKKRKTTIVQYDPNLPPAMFPSLDRLNSGPNANSSNPKPRVNGAEARRASRVQVVPRSFHFRHTGRPMEYSLGPGESENVPIDQLENHLASNNMDNSTYARNMQLACIPLPDAPSIPDDTITAGLDSDDDQLPDATQVLLEKIPNPAWSDLNPAMQAEIFENMRNEYNYWSLCRALDISEEEREKVEEYIGVRRKQILRENKALNQMRQKQRMALMNIDNSDLKLFEPPPQLVLKKIAKDTTRKLIDSYTGLILCQSHDFLKARQYLHQHGLDRRYAGDWRDSLVALKESAEDGPDPDKFEWEEELRFTPPPPPVDPARARALENVVNSINRESRDSIAPAVLIRRSTDQKPIQDWGRYYQKKKDGSWDTTKPRDGGMVKLNIGSQKAAAIARYEKTGVMPRSAMPKSAGLQGHSPHRAISQGRAPPFGVYQGALPHAGMPQGVAPPFFISPVTMPPVTTSQGGMPQFFITQGVTPQFIYPQGTYPQNARPQRPPRIRMSEPAPRSSTQLETPTPPSRVINHGAPSLGLGSPFIQQRALPAANCSRQWDHTDSQARYLRHMAKAKLERVEVQARSAERLDPRPIQRVSGFGTGGDVFRRPPQKLAEKVEEPLPSDSFDWEEHETLIRSTGYDVDLFRQYLHSDPPSENKEEKIEEIEQAKQVEQAGKEMEEATERPATQTTTRGVSSNTDVSMDDVQLVRTDGECSSP